MTNPASSPCADRPDSCYWNANLIRWVWNNKFSTPPFCVLGCSWNGYEWGLPVPPANQDAPLNPCGSCAWLVCDRQCGRCLPACTVKHYPPLICFRVCELVFSLLKNVSVLKSDVFNICACLHDIPYVESTAALCVLRGGTCATP
jgi:hypothetical protein